MASTPLPKSSRLVAPQFMDESPVEGFLVIVLPLDGVHIEECNPSDSFKADASPDKAWSNQVDAISASASLTADGTINVSLVNASPTESYPVELTFEGLNLTRANGRVLSGERLDAHNTFDKPETVRPRPIENVKTVGDTIHITLPPASVSVVSAG